MKHHTFTFILLFLLFAVSAPGFAASSAREPDGAEISQTSRAFVPSAFPEVPGQPALAEQPILPGTSVAGIWPFGKKEEAAEEKTVIQKSTRKAFFLSLLLPGLGEFYVGSKRGIAFLGVEAAAWWMYIHFTHKGKNLEDEFKRFADQHWRYSAEGGDYSYYGWLRYKIEDKALSSADSVAYRQLGEDLPKKYEDLAASPKYMETLGTKDISGVGESLPANKNQQYYEMIGKYPQFRYGWNDITTSYYIDNQGKKQLYNPALVDSMGNPKGNYSLVPISPNQSHYMDMRYQSNKNLKRGISGVQLMIINRIVSAIDASRLAYHHNKGLESELSMVRVNVVSTYIIDHEVPMLILSKKF